MLEINRPHDAAASPALLRPHLIVGIGASAGGLGAFTTFFQNMPAESGLSFVLIQHLDPNHHSILTELIARHTAMAVTTAEDGMTVAANCVYVIPPNVTLTIKDKILHMTTPAPSRDIRRPVDTFFSSLAKDQGDCAVCIVLSGTGSDGTLGLTAVKEHGGLTMAQGDFEAEPTAMSGMPHSAVATGLVDYVLPVADMPATLIEYQKHLTEVAAYKDGDGNRLDFEEYMPAIAELIRNGTGYDFQHYKHNTLVRRIQRRMQVLRIDKTPDYIERLRQDSGEVESLFHEFLIGVTKFFRDEAAFNTLRDTVIPDLVAKKGADDPIRVWVAGCATGEEVYSIAILLKEALYGVNNPPKVQIFGTDIDPSAVSFARTASYPKSVMTGLPPQLVERWFSLDRETYYPVTEIREMCVFSTHSVVKDPPFSKLDLISCRNLLIYLGNELQDRVMRTFHYALRPDGYLFLGLAEGVTRNEELFEAIDKKQRIFRRRETAAPSFLDLPMSRAGPAPHSSVPSTSRTIQRDRLDAEIQQVMKRHSPAYAVVNRRYHVLRFSGGEIGRFLAPSAGEASLNLFDIVHRSLRRAMRKAIQDMEKGGPASSEIVMADIDSAMRPIKMIVERLDGGSAAAKQYLIGFQEMIVPAADAADGQPYAATNVDVQTLEQELQSTRLELKATIQELESSIEEMKSTNEEYQSVNEEFQSSNEELETAKEEMQSVNEELQTINAEMSSKNDVLAALNSDLKNLLDSTDIATLFLDETLRVKNFTPKMTEIFNLRDADRGRPVTDLVMRLVDIDLKETVAQVLRTLSATEREVQLNNGDTFIMRTRPYRTVDNVIDGVVITFIDIAERKRGEQTRSQLAAIIQSSRDAIIGHALDGIITTWNEGAERLFGYSAGEAIGKPLSILLAPDQVDNVPQILNELQQGRRVEQFEINRLRKDGTSVDVSITISPVRGNHGDMIAAATIAREVTDRKVAEDQKSLLIEELNHRIKNILMIVNALISQTLRSNSKPEDFSEVVQGRVAALSRVHSLLINKDWDHAELYDIVAGELEPYNPPLASSRTAIRGDACIVLTAKSTLSLALAIHELATNAAKYGALSEPEGQVQVSWDLAPALAGPHVRFVWAESGGPPVTAPTRQGFGSQLIERTVMYDLKADVKRDFKPDGLTCTIEFQLTADLGHVR